MSTISIIVPVYKVRETYLRQCIESIINQTLRDLEIILIDDGSPDNCGAICDEYATNDSRIVVIHQENQGVSTARNAGLDAATGKWVMFVDADDWMDTDACERLLQKLSMQPAADAAIFANCFVYKDAMLPRAHATDVERVYSQADYTDALLPAMGRPMSRIGWINGSLRGVSCKLIQRRIIEDSHIRFIKNMSIIEDTMFFLEAFKRCDVILAVPSVQYYYRQRKQSAMNSFRPQACKEQIAVIHAFQTFCSDNNIGFDSELMIGRLYNSFFLICNQCILHAQQTQSSGECANWLKQIVSDEPYRRVFTPDAMRHFSTKERVKLALIKHGRFRSYQLLHKKCGENQRHKTYD